jgi:hypothetical protein
LKYVKTIATVLKINSIAAVIVQVILLQLLFIVGINEQISITILIVTNKIVMSEASNNL